MGFEHLKARSQQARGSAVPGEQSSMERTPTEQAAGTTVTPPPVVSTAASTVFPDKSTTLEAAFFDYWIAQLSALHGLSPEAAQTALRLALQQAPSHLRPSEDDARLFATAGASTLPYATVIDWLHIRKTVDVDAGRLSADTARYWLQRLAAGSKSATDGDWTTHCQTLAHTATRAGHGLPSTLVDALAAQPSDTVKGYLRCAALKTQLGEAAIRNSPPSPSDTEKVSPSSATTQKATEGRSRVSEGPTQPPPAVPSVSNPPVSGHPAMGGGVSATLGQCVGGLVGSAVSGAMAGFKAGFARMREGASVASHAEQAMAQAEAVLADFEAASRHLEQHPQLAAFWREVERLAQRGTDGQRSAVFRDMHAQPRHPLHTLFARQKATDPDVALWHERAHAAFERLQTVWTHTTRTSTTHGKGWSPTPEQQSRLRAACLGVPPTTDRPALTECAARLLRDLASGLRQAFQRSRAKTASPAPSP